MLGMYSKLDPENGFFPSSIPNLYFSPEMKWNYSSSSLYLIGDVYDFFDTEVIFDSKNLDSSFDQLFQKHGEDFVSKIIGNFLFWYRPNNLDTVFLVNNRHEATKLFFSESETKFLFSSSLQALISMIGKTPNPNFGSIRLFMANGFNLSEHLQIEGIQKALPADYFIFRKDPLTYERKSYWKKVFRFQRAKEIDVESKLQEYEWAYQKGIEYFLKSKGTPSVGCLLSGGHDTSFLVAQTRQVFSGPIHTFTVEFPGWRFDEGPYARRVAEKFGCIHHPISFQPSHLDSLVPMIQSIEEPVLGSSLSLYCLAKEAKPFVDVLLGGDGGDTVWGEYYPVEEYHRFVKVLPPFARSLAHTGSKILRDIFDWERFWELEHVASLFVENSYHQDFLRKLCTYRHFGDSFQKELLYKRFLDAPYSKAHNEVVFTDANFGEALIEGKLLNGFYTYQGHHTTKLCESSGIEFYMPTIQPHVLKFIMELPKQWINGGNAFQRLSNSKKINRVFHKKALSKYFKKEEIYNRSFDMPWFKLLLPRKELLSALSDSLKRRGWYQHSAIDGIFDSFQSQKPKDHEILELKNHGYRIFTLLCLEIWSKIFLDGTLVKKDEKIEDFLSRS